MAMVGGRICPAVVMPCDRVLTRRCINTVNHLVEGNGTRSYVQPKLV
jgi:hypothetical protein